MVADTAKYIAILNSARNASAACVDGEMADVALTEILAALILEIGLGDVSIVDLMLVSDAGNTMAHRN